MWVNCVEGDQLQPSAVVRAGLSHKTELISVCGAEGGLGVGCYHSNNSNPTLRIVDRAALCH